jgi:UDP:flavonoid glycosyltransferase YjiC (YdhE family)
MTIKRIAYFISPHGFGHAARAAAVMEALSESDPGVRFEIFTSVPSWFFEDSVSTPFTYHRVVTDIGLVQKNAFQADLEDSLRALNDYFPLEPSLIKHLAETIRALKCDLIVCDIAPMGILIAKEAQIPSILVENFTWDWIYQQYTVDNEHIRRHIDYLQPIFNAVDYHIIHCLQ